MPVRMNSLAFRHERGDTGKGIYITGKGDTELPDIELVLTADKIGVWPTFSGRQYSFVVMKLIENWNIYCEFRRALFDE